MPSLVKLNGIVDDNWQVITQEQLGSGAELPAGHILLPLTYWLAHAESLMNNPEIGVWLDSHEEPEALGDHCRKLPVIAVNFPKFTDGRGYSIARLLRERLAYKGQLRAIGDVLLDQLFYMKRCGFDAFALRPDKDINKAAQALQTFSEVYQAATDQDQPLFRRRQSQ